MTPLEGIDNDEHKTPELSDTESGKRYIVGAWRSVPEFRKVYAWIYSKGANNESKRRALSQIRVWNLRRGSLCPAAVLGTSIILQVQLDDASIVAATSATNSQIATLYSNAFIRFYNYMSSIIQTYNLKSMYETAKELNLNSFVVDLRHLCAHGQVIPPLDILRKTARYCLHWLHEYYWDVQNKIMRDIDASALKTNEKNSFSESIFDLLGVYDATLECHMEMANNLKSAKKLLSKERFIMFQTYVEYRNLDDFDSVFNSVVKDLFIVLKRETNIKDTATTFCEELLKMQFFMECGDSHTNSDENIERLINSTKQLYNSMAVFGFIETFVYMLFLIMENPNESKSRRSSASFWTEKIIDGYLALRTFVQIYKNECTKNVLFKGIDFNKMTIEATNYLMQMVLLNHGVNFNRTIIFCDSVRYPWVWEVSSGFLENKFETINEYTAPIVKQMLKMVTPALTPEDYQILVQQIDIMDFGKQKSTLQKKSSEIEIYSMKEILEILKQYEIEAGIIEGEREMGAWTAVPDASMQSWQSCPLGRLPSFQQ